MPAMTAKRGDKVDESCPVCKQSTYLNPNMKFKINPECYHRMCDSCIDRIFSSGPAPCPVAGCKHTLRKAKFRTQTFSDLTIERECDIRKRVNAILNKREEDFETLRDFNDYQEEKEELTWSLVNNQDIEQVNKKLKEFAKDNKDSIAENLEREEEEKQYVLRLEQDRERRTVENRQDLKRELAEERAARGAQAKSVVDSIMGGGDDPEEAARRARQRIVPHKAAVTVNSRTAEQVRADANRQDGGAFGSMPENAPKTGLSFAGMRRREKKEVLGPYDSFDGIKLVTEHYKLRQDGLYQNAHTEQARKDTVMLAGGYNVKDYYTRALFDAHAGLGVLLGQEKGQAMT